MNLDITIVNFVVWVKEYPYLPPFTILATLALLFAFLTLNVMYELTCKSNLNKKIRSWGLFAGWLSLACCTWSGTYLPSVPQESSAAIPNSFDTISPFTFFAGSSIVLFFPWLIFKFHEKTDRYTPINKNWIYRESIRPSIRILWKFILGMLAFCVPVIFLERYPIPLFFGISILSVSLLYQIFSHRFCLKNFQSPNTFEMNRIGGKLAPFLLLLVLIINHDSLLNNLLEVIILPSFDILNILIALGSLVLAWLAFIGISFSKPHQLNPNLRSIASYPIAIQLKDQTPLDEQQIYDTVIKCCPNGQVYFEQTSTGFKAKKAEIIVIDWEEYEEKEIENKRNDLHKKLIETLTAQSEESEGFQEFEVLNFIIERRHNGSIENVIPIENKTAILYRKIELKKIFQNFCKLKIGRLFATSVK